MDVSGESIASMLMVKEYASQVISSKQTASTVAIIILYFLISTNYESPL
jgi:hypothetical protein